ncbi:tetratricopeptide repeat protein [Glaciecola sp. MH2013]|uniref:tetratricopeptide repeat protein n=1 Tax=Glaciecola sp. MH2013 TaxID=2785524 RepID=UPI00189F9834|nr:tetratricopeptide repeat protein [Glaciecola sp. MH2013]MBF7073692.1 tetratricopeptide repeat protein [Glaciecola sp. MH2013]
MSVVNKMLKDLEQRENATANNADYVPMEGEGAKSRSLVVGLTLLVLILSALVLWLLPKQLERKDVAQVLVTQEPSQSSSPRTQSKNSQSDALQSSALQSDAIQNGALQSGALQSKNSQSDLSQTKHAPNTNEQAEKLASDSLESETLNSAVDNVANSSAQTNSAAINLKAQPASSSQAHIKTEPTAKPRVETAIALSPEPRLKEGQEFQQKEQALPSSAKQVLSEQEPVFSVSSNRRTQGSNNMLEQRIQLSLKNGDTAAAIKDLNELVQREPRNIGARKRLASLSFAQGDPIRAAMLLHQGVKLHPEDSSMRLMQARLLFRENKNSQALAILNEHPPTVLADNELLSFRAALAEKQGDYARSQSDYLTLLQRQPNNARWLLGLAISQDKQEFHEQAVATYKQVKSSNQLSTQVVSFVDGRLAALVGS